MAVTTARRPLLVRPGQGVRAGRPVRAMAAPCPRWCPPVPPARHGPLWGRMAAIAGPGIVGEWRAARPVRTGGRPLEQP